MAVRRPSVLLVVALVALASMRLSAAKTSVVHEGLTYDIFMLNGTKDTLSSNLTSAFWWGNFTTAYDACQQVAGGLGMPNTGLGPFFAHGETSNNGFSYYEVQRFAGGSCSGSVIFDTDFKSYVLNMAGYVPVPFASDGLGQEPSASPEASPSPSPDTSPSPSVSASPGTSGSPSPSALPDASPSPSLMPLNCSAAVLSPNILSSRLNSQVCAANQALRQGKQSKLVTTVTLSLLDASSRPVAVNITDILTNKATAGWQCRCRPTMRDNCTCLPNAVLLGGGSFLVMPQWRRSTLPGRVVDTTLQVFFTATAVNGDTCSGTAVICSAWGVRPNRPAPVCRPFDITGVTRPALTCI